MPGWKPCKSKLRFKPYGVQKGYLSVSYEEEHYKVLPIPEKALPISDDFLDDLM
jgi:hypothetical protein